MIMYYRRCYEANSVFSCKTSFSEMIIITFIIDFLSSKLYIISEVRSFHYKYTRSELK